MMFSSKIEILVACTLAAVAIIPSSQAVTGGGCFYFLPEAGSLHPFFTPVQLEYTPWAKTEAVQGVHVTLEGHTQI